MPAYLHPGVVAAYYAAMLIFAMSAFHPVYLAIVLVAGFALSVRLRGLRATLGSMAWQMPLLFIVALVNPLVSTSGSTELLRIGSRTVYLESLAYGICMGVMLVAVLLWFSNASRALSSDRVMALLGRALPLLGIMASMVMRLVPQFVRRARQQENVMKACTAAAGLGLDAEMSKRDSKSRMALKRRFRLMTVLMGWGMEDSIERADAMRSCGWSARRRRTSYERHPFRKRDAAALILLGLLIASNAFLAAIACSQYCFYPVMSTLIVWWGYAPFILMAFLPLLGEVVLWVRWNALRR